MSVLRSCWVSRALVRCDPGWRVVVGDEVHPLAGWMKQRQETLGCDNHAEDMIRHVPAIATAARNWEATALPDLELPESTRILLVAPGEPLPPDFADDGERPVVSKPIKPRPRSRGTAKLHNVPAVG